MARRVFRAFTSLLLVAGLLLGALMVVPALFGIQRYVIVSGSMTGTYDRGSVVFDQVVPVASLKVGDVITYRPPAGAGPDHLVTHRIAAITADQSGGRVFRTKGDANEVADPWTFTLRGPDAGEGARRRAVRRLRHLRAVGSPAADDPHRPSRVADRSVEPRRPVA